MMMTQRNSLFTRLVRRTVGMLAEIHYAQRRMGEIMTNPTGE
jgi:hypothetical protein